MPSEKQRGFQIIYIHVDIWNQTAYVVTNKSESRKRNMTEMDKLKNMEEFWNRDDEISAAVRNSQSARESVFGRNAHTPFASVYSPV